MPPESKKPYKGTLELTGETYERFSALVTARRSTLKACVQEAVNLWLERASTKNLGTSTEPRIDFVTNQVTIQDGTGKSITVDAAEWQRIDQVLGVLRGSVDTARIALEKNLDAFTRLMELSQGLPHGGSRPAVPPSPADQQAALARERELAEGTEREMATPVRAREETPGKRDAATGTGGSVRTRRKPDPGRSGSGR